MYNLIKSHNYTLRRDMLSMITLITVFVLPYILICFSGPLEGVNFADMTASKYMLIIGATIPEIFLFAVMIFTAKAVGGDGGDKTINYELMCGHSRDKVYWSRIITGFVWGILIVFIASLIPYAVITLINGWGDNLDKTELFVRLGLTIFPTIRIAAIFMLITSLVGSAGGGMAISYGIVMIETILDAVLDEIDLFDGTCVLGLSNIHKLLTYNNSWEFVENGKAITWFYYTTSNDLIVKTIIVSLIMAGIYVSIGYFVFKKRDNS